MVVSSKRAGVTSVKSFGQIAGLQQPSADCNALSPLPTRTVALSESFASPSDERHNLTLGTLLQADLSVSLQT